MPGSLHLSVDDVAACLRDLGDGDHATPWTQPTFAYLRELHERTGAAVSLYAFLEDGAWSLEDVPTRHRLAFTAASAWLRFGFHGQGAVTAYGAGGAPVGAAREHYERFVAAVRGFAGPAAIDRLPRVHRFLGRLDAVRAWRDAEAGVVGLLTADDDRAEVCHLDAASTVAPRCLFTHEPDLADVAVRTRIEEAVAWAARRGVGWAFPQDVLTAPSPASDAADAS